MLLNNNKYDLDSDIEFLFERPVGWSSACLDSTIDYYLNCNYDDLELKEDAEIEKSHN